MKKCSKCKNNPKTNYHAWCKPCLAFLAKMYTRKRAKILGWPKKKEAARRRRKEKNPILLANDRKQAAVARLRWPEKAKARGILKMAVEKGTVYKPTHCSKCSEPGRIEGHHDDYSKPLKVEWLCVSFHRNIHRSLDRKVGEKI